MELNSIYWFRQDLRLSDNPALISASEKGNFLPIYILDDINSGEFKIGGASRVWLYHSLSILDESLGSKLNFYLGDPCTIILDIVNRLNIKFVTWNRCYEPWRIERDLIIKKELRKNNVRVETFNGSLLWEPWEVLNQDRKFYRVFTPFYNKGCLLKKPPRMPLEKPKELKLTEKDFKSVDISDLNLLPKTNWHKSLTSLWKFGEKNAKKRLKSFLIEGLKGYKMGRNFPGKQNVSRISPYLHTGELSPNQVWYEAKHSKELKDLTSFHSEIVWREFSYYLLYHFPNLPKNNFQEKFNLFPWNSHQKNFDLWKRGMTGYPIVDAGMRELYKTGYMHNRTRMIVGSFLVKNLLIHWRYGELWFWDCLFDADLANNSASWQWIAGSGADAAPYFRIFNPVLQGQKFDPDGIYTLKFVPELRKIPKKYLFSPWLAPKTILKNAGIELGVTYPEPVIELKESREKALSAFEKIKKNRDVQFNFNSW